MMSSAGNQKIYFVKWMGRHWFSWLI